MSDHVSGIVAPRSLRRSDRMRHAATVVGLSAAMLAPGHALAQQTDEPLASVTVEDTAIDPNPNAQVGVPYKARTSGDERRTRPLAETPATITVLTRAQIEESGYTDLVRILDAQPGVTVGTGENGNAFGDRYIIRGQEARSDVFVDGLRDPGMTTRESFAIEQLEIAKGPNSSFAGRGTSGGAINAITKQATTDMNFGRADVSVGTDRYVRTTADLNYALSDTFALRANVLYHYQNVPDRAPADRQRYGGAISALFKPTDDLQINLDYYGLRAHDNPDAGDYLDGNLSPVRTPVYAQAEDFQKSDVNTVTGRIKYSFSPDVRITNLTRYGTSENGYVLTGMRAATTSSFDPNGIYPTITLSTHQGWQEVEYFANQTNLYANVDLFGAKHEFILGVEYTNHKVLNGVYTVANRAPNCRTQNTAGAPNNFCIIDPSGQRVGGDLRTWLGRSITRGNFDQDWQMESVSAYLMDTFDLTPSLTAFAGLRLDHFNFYLGMQDPTTLALTPYSYGDTFLNGHLGLTYKVGGGGMFYASVASSADVNCGESDVGTSSAYGGCIVQSGKIAGARPERSWNFEIGTKWNVFNEKLLLTAALFQTNKSGIIEGIPGYTATGSFNSGANRVRGLELSVAGNVTDSWSVQGGLTWMESEITKAANPLNVGKSLSNFAKFQASLQTRYQVTEKFAIGGAIKHKSRRYGGQPDTAPSYTTNPDGSYFYSRPVPAYTVGDIFAEYHVNDNIEFRLNVNNITDTKYYLAVYQGGFFMYKGDARQVVGTLSVKF